jgi:hypothetical protein
MAPTSTSATLIAMDQERREYVSNIWGRLIEDYVMQLDNFHSKGKSSRKIRLGEVVFIHDEHTKRLLWSTRLVTELRPSRDGLIRSVVLRTANGNHINRAIQCLYPLAVFQEPEDVITQDEAGPEPVEDLAPPDPAPMINDPAPNDPDLAPSNPDPAPNDPDPAPNDPDPAIREVEPDDTGFGGEYVGNIPTPQQPISRSGRQSRLPRHLHDYYLRGPR